MVDVPERRNIDVPQLVSLDQLIELMRVAKTNTKIIMPCFSDECKGSRQTLQYVGRIEPRRADDIYSHLYHFVCLGCEQERYYGIVKEKKEPPRHFM